MKRPLVKALAFVFLTLLISPRLGYASPGFSLEPRQGRGLSSYFQVPQKLRARVDFWKDVFAKYGRHQLIIHHRDFPQVVFGILDFSAEAETLSDRELARHKDRVERETIASMKEQIRALINGAQPSTPFQESFIEKMSLIPEGARSYVRLLEEDLIRTQTGIRERYAQAIGRAWRYLPIMEQIFASEYGLPRELTRLPFIESSFDYTAYSSVGAAGIWQFMPRTARSHRMLVGKYVDERRDPVKATRGAAAYLRSAYQELGAWPLAITSYNHGVGGVRSKVRAAGTSDLAEIIEHPSERFFGFASTNFYPEFLAAVEIFAEHERYFPEVQEQPPLRLVAYPIKASTSVGVASQRFGIPLDSLREANYALLEPVWRGQARIPAGYILQVPVQYTEHVNRLPTPVVRPVQVSKIAIEGDEPPPQPLVTRSSSPQRVPVARKHKVAKGDTLTGLSKRYGVSADAIKRASNIRSARIAVGQVLTVPHDTNFSQ